MKICKTILDAIGNTPIIQMNHLSPKKSVKIFAKFEGMNPTGSIKDRIALKMINQAEKEGKLRKGQTIIEPTSGNTGIGLAMVGVVKGYKVEIVMSKAVSVERVKMIKAFGAKVTRTPANLGTDGAIRKARLLVKKYPKKYFMPDQFSNEFNKLAHYYTTAKEIWQQMSGKIDYVASALGTSGTIMGLATYLKKKNPKIKVVCAQPVKGHYIQGLKNMQEALVPSIYDPSKIDIMEMIESEDAFEMTRNIVKKEAIFCGMSSGAAMLAAVNVAKRIKKGNIIVVFPDRGEKYLSTDLFKV